MVALALVVLCPLAYVYTRQLDEARAKYEPPTVFITEPADGVVAPAGSYVSVSATAVGHSPITQAELWVDGEFVQEEVSEQPEGLSPFGAHFDVLVLEGPHMLFVRAVNVEGIIGQSQPVGVVGEAGPREALLAVTAGQGETLGDIADSNDSDLATLQELNPELGGEEPISGTVVIVPAPPEQPEDDGPLPPSVGPAISPSGPGAGPVQIPDIPPLRPIVPSANMTGTVTLPIIVGQFRPGVMRPVFQPPAAPTNLQAQVTDCKARLRWNDNAWSEARYEVWMAALGSPQRLLASLEPAAGGAAWVEFPAPQPGELSFWVEAVNSVGAQPSNIVWVEVDPQCPSTVPSQLQVEVLDMTVGGAYDRAYCYVSLEDTPEVRMPGDDSDFVQVSGGQANIATWDASSRNFVLPIPGDDSLEMTGECWGWAGQRLSDLGTFSEVYAGETWDGTRRPLEAGTYQIGIALDTYGGEMDDGDTLQTYGYEDPTMPTPYDLRVERVGSDSSLDPLAEWEWFWQRRLSWKWSGDPTKLTGFQIYVDGDAYKSVKAGERSAVVTLPAWCGLSPIWEVTATAGNAESRRSVPVDSALPKCTRYVEVWFQKIYWTYTTDGLFGGDCSDCEAYGEIGIEVGGRRLRQQCADFYFYKKVKCGSYFEISGLCAPHRPQVADVGPEGADTIVLPFYEDDSQDIVFEVFARFWDGDDWSSDDLIADYAEEHRFADLKAAQSALGCGKDFMASDCAEDGCSRLWYGLIVYPNACADVPP